LQAKVLQVDRWVRQTPHRVVEVHPEASFAEIGGTALQSRKSSWAGIALRRQLLAGAGISLPEDIGLAGEKAAADDVLDAAAAAWTAVRVLRDQARPSPSPPELFSDGLPSAIWTPCRIRASVFLLPVHAAGAQNAVLWRMVVRPRRPARSRGRLTA
jgi:predicted RNase H-like nuclease